MVTGKSVQDTIRLYFGVRGVKTEVDTERNVVRFSITSNRSPEDKIKYINEVSESYGFETYLYTNDETTLTGIIRIK